MILGIVKDAERFQESANYKEMDEKMYSSGDLETGSKICGYRAQLISVKLEQVTAALQLLMLDKAVPKGPRGTSKSIMGFESSLQRFRPP